MHGFGGVDIENDGIYCRKCNKLHPSLYWHEKYDEYLEYEQWIERFKIVLARSGFECSEKEIDIEYNKLLRIRDLSFSVTLGKCVICECETHFMHHETNHYVCSDECKYDDWRLFAYTLSMEVDPEVFHNACLRLKQVGAVNQGQILEDVDGSLIMYYSFNGKRIRIDCDYELDAVCVESQCNLSDVLKGMIMLAREY